MMHLGKTGASTPIGGSLTKIAPKTKIAKGKANGGRQPRHRIRNRLPFGTGSITANDHTQAIASNRVMGQKYSTKSNACWAKVKKYIMPFKDTTSSADKPMK